MKKFYDDPTKKPIRLEEVNGPIARDAGAAVSEWEERYRVQVEAAADRIASSLDSVRIILLAGPSGSGKTTTANKISEALKERNVGSFVVSLDDFFMGAGNYPKLPDGSPDYESIYALNLPQLHSCFEDLLEKGKTMFPSFDFTTGMPRPERHPVLLPEKSVLIVEGIHALNPLILPEKHHKGFLKIYVCVNSFFTDGDEMALCTRDIRLMRRMIRDYQFRSASPERTLGMWQNVCRGEAVNIRPFKTEADILIDSLHLYEPCIYHHFLLPLLHEVQRENPESRHADKMEKLCAALELFDDLPLSVVPKDTMIREFLGGDA